MERQPERLRRRRIVANLGICLETARPTKLSKRVNSHTKRKYTTLGRLKSLRAVLFHSSDYLETEAVH